MRTDIIPSNPADKVELPKIQKYNPSFYTSDEVKGLGDNKKVDVSDEDIDIKDVLNKINKKTKLKDLENLKDHNKNEG